MSLDRRKGVSLDRREGVSLDRPNILWFVSEDCSPPGGVLGDGLARTPTIDRMASEGITFEAAFATAPVCAPSRFAIISGIYGQSCGPAEHMSATAHFPSEFRTYPEVLRSRGYYCTNSWKTHYNADIRAAEIWDESSHGAHWRNAPPDHPFLAVFNCLSTHETALFHERVGPVSPDEVRVPAYLPDTHEVREDLARYYAAVERMDAEFGVRIEELDRAGLLDDTIIIYSSDHGGVSPWTKRFCYDGGLRVPLVVRVPPRWQYLARYKPGTVVSTPVSLVDIAPTLLSLAGAEVPDQMAGTPILESGATVRAFAFGARDRMDERYDLTRTARSERYRYIRNYAPHRPWGQHLGSPWRAPAYQVWEQYYLDGKLNAVQRRFWEQKAAEELYDTAADPDHINNLAGDPAHRRTLAEMSRALDEHMLCIVDNGFIPEGSSPEGYHESRDVRHYPLERIMRLAALAIERDPRNLDELRTLLSDENDVIRFWAAEGLLMLEAAAIPARIDLIRSAESDTSSAVRICAAEALSHVDSGVEAVGLLQNELAVSPSPLVRLQALNSLTYVRGSAIAALPTIERFEDDDDEYVRGAARYLGFVLRGEYAPSAEVFLESRHVSSH